MEEKEITKSKTRGVLYGLIGVILVLTLVNTLSLFSLGQAVGPLQGNQLLANVPASTGNTGIEETVPVANQNNDVVNQPPVQTAPVNASADDDSFLGSEDALVTIIEFSDYECPFCARFYSQTLPSLKKEYIETGKVKFVYRDFPIGSHRYAQKAAEAAECADKQGKYWEMHNQIFENQGSIDVVNLKQFAQTIGLDSTEFDLCLDSGEMASEVQKDFSDGQKYGVSGTPTFFINGTKIVGAQPFSTFEQLIESELAKGGN